MKGMMPLYVLNEILLIGFTWLISFIAWIQLQSLILMHWLNFIRSPPFADCNPVVVAVCFEHASVIVETLKFLHSKKKSTSKHLFFAA